MASGVLCEEVLCTQAKQNSSDVGEVFSLNTRVDKYVVDVQIREATEVFQETVHCALERTGGIKKSKRHYAKL